MAGTITVSTISDGTNSTSSTNCIQGSAKAWVSYNGNTTTVRGSYNVSSVTRNGTGDYTFNFTNALSSANYSAVGTSQALTYDKSYVSIPNTGSTYSTTQVRLVCVAFNGSNYNNTDATIFNVVVLI